MGIVGLAVLLGTVSAQLPKREDCCGISFGPNPLPADLARGSAAAKRDGTDRCTLDAKIVLGTWFDGVRKQPVEELVFLTPGHLSRWIGYGIAKGESLEKSQQLWNNFSGLARGKTLAVVRLARLCTVDIGDGNIAPTAVPEGLDSVTLRFRCLGAEWKEVPITVIQDIQDRDPKLVWRESWDRALASVMIWPSKPSEFPMVSEIRWGKNRMVTAIADFPVVSPKTPCEIEITEVGRQRVIPFKFPGS